MGKSVISIRPCRQSDCEFLWNLRNEKSIRESVFNTDYVPYQKHRQWFGRKISDEKFHIFIILKGGRRIGQVRLDLVGKGSAEIDIGVLEKERSKGFGSHALKPVYLYGLKYLHLKRIIAYVKKENVPSLRAFSKAHFSKGEMVNIKRRAAYKMVLR